MENPADCPSSQTSTSSGRLPVACHWFSKPQLAYTLWLLFLYGVMALTACDLSDLEDSVEGLVQSPQFDPIAVSYPPTPRDSAVVDDYYGYTIADNYRWLEQDTAEQVLAWSSDQNKLTKEYLSKVPFYDAVRERLDQLKAYYRRGIPSYHGDHYYFTYNSGDWPRDALARTKGLTDSVTIVLNPNSWEEGTAFELGKYAFSADGRYLVYEQHHKLTGESKLKVVDLEESLALSDELRVRGVSTLRWHRTGFYYTSYPSPDDGRPQLFHRLYYHQLGTPQREDELVFADYRNPERRIMAFPDTNTNSLVLEIRGDGPGNAAYYRPLDSDDPSFVPLIENLDYRFEWAGGSSEHLHFVTDLGADKSRLIKVNKEQPQRSYWETIIPERGDLMGKVWRYADQWIVDYWRDATSHVLLFSTTGQEQRRLHLPEPGTITAFSAGKTSQELFFGFTSYLRPETVYRLDAGSYRSALLYSPHPSFTAEKYTLRQEWVTAYDNTPIPIFILHQKENPLSQPKFTLLVNAQHEQDAQMPHWNATGHYLIPAVLEQGGVVVVANLRGSSGFGRRWQNSGRLTQQQQSLDDLQAVAEYLREQQFVVADRLGVYSTGVGATLVGATLNQRPDLFAATAIEDGWYDLLRYQLFAGAVPKLAQFGSVRDSIQNDHLLSYSPLQNVLPNNFPATLVVASQNSTQGVPLHSRKLAAELQGQQKGAGPILLYTRPSNTQAGADKQVNTGAAILSFLFYQTKTNWE